MIFWRNTSREGSGIRAAWKVSWRRRANCLSWLYLAEMLTGVTWLLFKICSAKQQSPCRGSAERVVPKEEAKDAVIQITARLAW